LLPARRRRLANTEIGQFQNSVPRFYFAVAAIGGARSRRNSLAGANGASAPFLFVGAYGGSLRRLWGCLGSLYQRHGFVLGRGACGTTRVGRVAPGALGTSLGAARRPMRASRWSCDHDLAPALDLFPRPFGFLSPAPASNGAGSGLARPIRGASPGDRGSFLGPPSPHATAAVRKNPSEASSIQG
jgi:hypothetical protein